MKKIVSLLFCLSVLVLFSSCGHYHAHHQYVNEEVYPIEPYPVNHYAVILNFDLSQISSNDNFSHIKYLDFTYSYDYCVGYDCQWRLTANEYQNLNLNNVVKLYGPNTRLRNDNLVLGYYDGGRSLEKEYYSPDEDFDFMFPPFDEPCNLTSRSFTPGVYKVILDTEPAYTLRGRELGFWITCKIIKI